MSLHIRRRDFIKTAIAFGGTSAMAPLKRAWGAQSPSATAEAMRVKRVLAMFKCHFDAGFIDTQQHVVERYFQVYFPLAMRVAAASRQRGQNRYVWTTGSWLLYNYLEQASPAQRAAAEAAIAAGDLAWHALPFNWQTELMDESQIAGSLGISRSLDSRFGKVTTGAKMTDVPGHTRGLVAPLAAGGVTFLDIGVNGASRPAELPPLFVWKDTRGNALTVMYHHDYGGLVQVPGSDLAIAIVVRGDNSGPHTPAEIDAIYAGLKRQFPSAEIVATGLGEIAEAALPYRENLPVVTQEIGDTWIYGVPSDPIKVARYREVSRLRQSWIRRGAFQTGDRTDLTLLSNLLLEAEHTWGTDTKTWLDFDHYTPEQLQAMLPTKNYQVVAYSWKEKRQDLFSALATLPDELRGEAEKSIAALAPQEPTIRKTHGWHSHTELENDFFHLQLDRHTGAIRRLLSKKSGCEWAAPDHPLALISYQTLSMKDYEGFFERYIISTADWARKDFGKPKIDQFGAASRTWYPSVDEVSINKVADGQRLQFVSTIKDATAARSGLASFPRKFYTELFLSNSEAAISINVSWFGKQATRLPESLWLSFNPRTEDSATWMLEKCSEPISPLDVVRSGARHMHAVSSGVSCQSGKGTLFIDTIDAPVVAIGERSPLNFSEANPDLTNGVHCNLLNNAWGTNYIQWFGEDCKLRFRIRELVSQDSESAIHS